MDIYNRASMTVGTLQKGVEYYLDHWQDIQENKGFPINSDQEMYRAESIIHRIVTIQNAILLAQKDDNGYIDHLFSSLDTICKFTDEGYSEYFQKINEYSKRGLT